MTTLTFVLKNGNNVNIIDEICDGVDHIHSLSFKVKFECLENGDGYLLDLAYDISKNNTFRNLKIDKLRVYDVSLAFYLRRYIENVKELVICADFGFSHSEICDMKELGINFRFWKTNTKDKVYIKTNRFRIPSLNNIKYININATSSSGFSLDQIKTILSGNIDKLTIKIDDEYTSENIDDILNIICNTSATRIKIIGRLLTINNIKCLLQMNGITELKLEKEYSPAFPYTGRNFDELEKILNECYTITNLVLYRPYLVLRIKNIIERNIQLSYNNRFVHTKPIM